MRSLKLFGIGFGIMAIFIGVIASAVWTVTNGYWPVTIFIMCSAIGLLVVGLEADFNV